MRSLNLRNRHKTVPLFKSFQSFQSFKSFKMMGGIILVEMRGAYLTLLRRSAIRVCQPPGPVAFQRAMTFAGRRREMSFLGLSDRGRPPFFICARANVSSVSSGSSSYSLD